MNYGGDAADQIVRYSLEGTEVALKLTGEAAKNFAVFAAAVLRDQKKMHGKTNLTRLLRENKPLRFFEVPESRMKEFAREANVRGLLYVPVRDRSKAAGKIEFAVWAEDAVKVNRVLEKMGVDYLQADTGAKAEVGPMPAAEQQAAVQTEVVEMPEGRIAFEVTELDGAFNVGGNFTQRTDPDMPAAEKSPSAPSSPQRSSTQPQPEKSAERIRAEGDRPSVKQELGELKREQARKKAAERRPPQRRSPSSNRKKQKGR